MCPPGEEEVLHKVLCKIDLFMLSELLLRAELGGFIFLLLFGRKTVINFKVGKLESVVPLFSAKRATTKKKGSFGSIEEGKRAKLPIRGNIRNIHYLLLRFFAFARGASLRPSILLAAGTSERAWCFATRIRALSDQERDRGDAID